jgi:hypothetical protein
MAWLSGHIATPFLPLLGEVYNEMRRRLGWIG